MKTGFGKHYMADLYLCQNSLLEIIDNLKTEINKSTAFLEIGEIVWKFDTSKPNGIRITGEIDDFSYILIQVFPNQNFIAVDLFSWQPQLDLQSFSEVLINIFAPQVVAAETKIRAEHL